MGDSVTGRLQADRLAFDQGPARIGAFGAEHQPRRLGTPGPEQAGQTHHLAVMKHEIERRHVACLAIALEARADLAHRTGVLRCARTGGLRELAAEHHPYQFDARQLSGHSFADQAAVAQHRDAIADFIDLVEKVGDEEDANSARGQLAHHREQNLDLVAIEACGRLVEDQHACRQVHGARDGSNVLDRDRIVAERCRYIDMQIKLRQQRGSATAHLGVTDQTKTGRLPSEIEVLRHRQVRQQIDLLIDRGDPGIERGPRRPCHDFGAAKPDNSGIALEHAGHHLDQRGLAGAVLAEQRVDLAGPQGEIHLLQRLQCAETFA